MRQRRSATIVAAAAAAAATVLLAACGSGGSSPVNAGANASQSPLEQAACKEGSVVVYQLNVTPAVTDVNTAFQKQYPCVRVNSTQGVGGTLLTKFNAATAAKSSPDVLEISLAGNMIDMAKAGDFLQYTPPAAAQLDIPDAFKATAGSVFPDTYVQMGIAYNTDTVSDQTMQSFLSWQDINSPALKNLKIGFISPAAGGTALTAFYYLENVVGKAAASSFLASHHIVTYATSQPAAEAVASGQIDVALPMSANSALALWAKGAPVHYRVLSPEIAIPNVIGIPKDAAHPNAAKLYENFILSPTAQALYNTEAFQSPANTTVKDARKNVSESWWIAPTSTYSFDPVTVSAQGDALIALYNSLPKGH